VKGKKLSKKQKQRNIVVDLMTLKNRTLIFADQADTCGLFYYLDFIRIKLQQVGVD
jgi:hypothetical protein